VESSSKRLLGPRWPLVPRVSKCSRRFESTEHAPAHDDRVLLLGRVLLLDPLDLVRIPARLVFAQGLDAPFSAFLGAVGDPDAHHGSRIARAGDVQLVATRVEEREQRATATQRREECRERFRLLDPECRVFARHVGQLALLLQLVEQSHGRRHDLLVHLDERVPDRGLHDRVLLVELRSRGWWRPAKEGPESTGAAGAFFRALKVGEGKVRVGAAEDEVQLARDVGNEG
jgi:hypothetical protein